MGRPSKLTPKIEEIIFECIALGLTYEKVAFAAGVSRHTLINWRKRGQKAKSGIYFNFFNKLKAAEAAGERINLQKIRDAAVGGQEVKQSKKFYRGNKIVKRITTTKKTPPDWRAAAWILERRYPEKYGKHRIQDDSYHPVYGDYDIFILAKTLARMPKDQIEKLKSLLKKGAISVAF
jgi:hypothetical protein